jgi:hypothetical protein
MADVPYRLPAHPLVVGATAAVRMEQPAVHASWSAFRAEDFQSGLAEATITAARHAWKAAPRSRRAAKPTAEDHDNWVSGLRDEIKAGAPPGTLPAVVWPDPDELDNFSTSADRRPFSLVAGYLGGCEERDGRPPSQILFLEANLATWLLVPLKDIAVHNRVEDDSAAFGVRDVLWLKPNARVVRGDETDSVASSYLNGPFISADDIAPTVTGGTFPGTGGGLLLEAITPGCCGKSR